MACSGSKVGSGEDAGGQSDAGMSQLDGGTEDVVNAPDVLESDVANDVASTDSGLPPIDPQTNVHDLTAAQKAELCDWATNLLGGYGHVTMCAMGTVSNAANQAQCVTETFRSSCMFTVGQFENCTLAEVPSGGCNMPYNVCQPVGACP
jgi:hypothetical protein